MSEIIRPTYYEDNDGYHWRIWLDYAAKCYRVTRHDLSRPNPGKYQTRDQAITAIESYTGRVRQITEPRTFVDGK